MPCPYVYQAPNSTVGAQPVARASGPAAATAGRRARHAVPACSRLLGGRELDAGEAHYRLLVDVPLFVVENLASNPLDRLQKGVDRRVAAPAQLILVGMD